jgi:hypothetical protein
MQLLTALDLRNRLWVEKDRARAYISTGFWQEIGIHFVVARVVGIDHDLHCRSLHIGRRIKPDRATAKDEHLLAHRVLPLSDDSARVPPLGNEKTAWPRQF